MGTTPERNQNLPDCPTSSSGEAVQWRFPESGVVEHGRRVSRLAGHWLAMTAIVLGCATAGLYLFSIASRNWRLLLPGLRRRSGVVAIGPHRRLQAGLQADGYLSVPGDPLPAGLSLGSAVGDGHRPGLVGGGKAGLPAGDAWHRVRDGRIGLPDRAPEGTPAEPSRRGGYRPAHCALRFTRY